MKNIREILSQGNPEDAIFINRDLSWLAFNDRVSYQSLRWQSIPIMERLKFIGIASNNLDEFTMVRFASIYNKWQRGNNTSEISGMLPEEELEAVYDGILKQRESILHTFHINREQLAERDIHFVNYQDLRRAEKRELDDRFMKAIYPIVSPIVYDTTKELPLIHSTELTLVVNLQDKRNPNIEAMAFIALEGIQRLWVLHEGNTTKLVLLEDLMANNLHRIFIHKTVLNHGYFRILRNADVELSHDQDEYLVDRMQNVLMKRRTNPPVMMEISSTLDKRTMKLIGNLMGVEKQFIYKTKEMMDLSFLMDFPKMELEDGYYPPFQPQYPQELIGERDIFSAIEEGDILLQHPYESFEPVIHFLNQAANHPDVISIRQTLYRVSSTESPIVNALCEAARRGKQVYVLLELKARFDEAQNLSLVDKMKMAGCKIVYGIEDLKIHCKMIHIVKKTNKGVKMYSHIGTGNYNDKTAKLYTDISFFTAKQEIGKDLVAIFNLLSGFSEPGRRDISKIFFSPYNIRYQLNKLIDKEIKKGKRGYVFLKMNSLSDQAMIEKLYEANDAGVTVNIISRGICSATMDLPNGGRRKNFLIRSIVGRFLEHDRIYVFGKGENAKVLISSADLLTRNLDYRIELMAPIEDLNCKLKIQRIIEKLHRDTFNSFIEMGQGKYHKVTVKDKEEYDCHAGLMKQAIKNYRLRTIPKMKTRR